jgi:2,4-dienoyl-CoA reductase-like NADH-dependent reductase (Old Yellow Enzyme family)
MTAAKLFQPISIKSVTARNRIVVSPMCQYQSEEGSPTDWHLVHMGRYAVGGAGIVFYEETAVEDRGRKTHACAGLYREEQIPEFKRITDFVRKFGSVPAIQLGHAGGRASERGPLFGRVALAGEDAWQAVSSSATPIKEGAPVPRAMDEGDIRTVVQAFADAARRSLDAGFEILEIHGAHGYLIQQFLSPLINKRNDSYGGSLEGRMRFPLEVTEAVRAVWPQDKPLFFRISSVDGKGGLWSLEDSVALSRELKGLGVDLIDCSSGGLTGTSAMAAVPRIPGYHVPYARRIKDVTGMMTMAPGLITDPHQAEALLQEGDIDLIGMARELMFNADWPVHAAQALKVPDYLELFPPEFTFRLKLREEQGQMPINAQGARIPTGVSEFVEGVQR